MEQTTQTTRRIVRRMCKLTLLVSALCFGVSSFLLTPLYIQLASNIAYAEAWWTYVLYYLTSEGLIDLTVFAVCYPAAMYAVWHAGFKGGIRVPVAFSLVTLGKFVVNFFMTAITDSALPDVQEFLTADLPMIGIMYVLELLQYALPILFTLWLKRRYEAREGIWSTEENEVDLFASSAPLYTFTRLVSFKNPVQLAAFLMGVVVFAFRFVMHQIYQYTLYITSGYTDGLFIMVLDFVSDLFVAVILYFIALLLFSRFYRKDTEHLA